MCFHKADYLWDLFTCPLPKAQDCSYGAFSLRFIYFSGKEACLNLSPYFLLNLAHSGHSGILAFGRLYPPHFWGKHWLPGAQSLAVRSHCSRLRSPRVSARHPFPASAHFGLVLSSLSSLLWVPFPFVTVTSWHLLRVSLLPLAHLCPLKPKASSPALWHSVTTIASATAENPQGSGPFSALRFSSCALCPGQGTTGSSGADGARVQGRTLRDALYPSGLVERKIILHFLK